MSRYYSELAPSLKIIGATNLANNLRWFGIIDSPQILLHSSVIVSTLVQEVAVLAVDGILLKRINADLLRKIDSQDVEVSLVEDFQPLLQTLLAIPEDLHNVSEHDPASNHKVNKPSHQS